MGNFPIYVVTIYKNTFFCLRKLHVPYVLDVSLSDINKHNSLPFYPNAIFLLWCHFLATCQIHFFKLTVFEKFLEEGNNTDIILTPISSMAYHYALTDDKTSVRTGNRHGEDIFKERYIFKSFCEISKYTHFEFVNVDKSK